MSIPHIITFTYDSGKKESKATNTQPDKYCIRAKDMNDIADKLNELVYSVNEHEERITRISITPDSVKSITLNGITYTPQNNNIDLGNITAGTSNVSISAETTTNGTILSWTIDGETDSINIEKEKSYNSLDNLPTISGQYITGEISGLINTLINNLIFDDTATITITNSNNNIPLTQNVIINNFKIADVSVSDNSILSVDSDNLPDGIECTIVDNEIYISGTPNTNGTINSVIYIDSPTAKLKSITLTFNITKNYQYTFSGSSSNVFIMNNQLYTLNNFETITPNKSWKQIHGNNNSNLYISSDSYTYPGVYLINGTDTTQILGDCYCVRIV